MTELTKSALMDLNQVLDSRARPRVKPEHNRLNVRRSLDSFLTSPNKGRTATTAVAEALDPKSVIRDFLVSGGVFAGNTAHAMGLKSPYLDYLGKQLRTAGTRIAGSPIGQATAGNRAAKAIKSFSQHGHNKALAANTKQIAKGVSNALAGVKIRSGGQVVGGIPLGRRTGRLAAVPVAALAAWRLLGSLRDSAE